MAKQNAIFGVNAGVQNNVEKVAVAAQPSKEESIANAKKLLNHAKNILKQLQDGNTKAPSSGSAAAVKGMFHAPLTGPSNKIHGVMMNNEPFKREDMKHFNKPPIDPMVDRRGKKITQTRWDQMSDWDKHDAYTHTKGANETLAQQGKPPINDAMIADANTPNDNAAAGRMQDLIEGKQKDGAAIPVGDPKAPVNANNKPLTALQHAAKLEALKAEGIVPTFNNNDVPQNDNDVDRNNLANALNKKAIRGESVEGPDAIDWSGFEPNGDVRKSMDKGISSKTFAGMDNDIKNALRNGNCGIVMPDNFDVDTKNRLNQEAVAGRKLYRKLVTQGHIPEEIGFDPKKSNNGKGVDARAINTASKVPMVLNVGPQDHNDLSAGAAKEGLMFDDVNKLINIKDPFSDVDRESGLGGQQFDKPQKIRFGKVVKHVGENKEVPMLKNAKDISLGINDQPTGAVFLGKQKGPNQGGITDRSVIMAPPQMTLPEGQKDTPRVSLQTGEGRDDPKVNKGLFQRIKTDFNNVSENGKKMSTAKIESSIKAGDWTSLELPTTDVHPDAFKLRKSNYNTETAVDEKIPVFRDTNGPIQDNPPMKKQTVTFGGQSRTYAVLDDDVSYIPEVVQSTEKPGKKAVKPVISHGEVISDNQVTRSASSSHMRTPSNFDISNLQQSA